THDRQGDEWRWPRHRKRSCAAAAKRTIVRYCLQRHICIFIPRLQAGQSHSQKNIGRPGKLKANPAACHAATSPNKAPRIASTEAIPRTNRRRTTIPRYVACRTPPHPRSSRSVGTYAGLTSCRSCVCHQRCGKSGLCVPKTLSVLIGGGNHLTSAHNDRAAMFPHGFAEMSSNSATAAPRGSHQVACDKKRGSGHRR